MCQCQYSGWAFFFIYFLFFCFCFCFELIISKFHDMKVAPRGRSTCLIEGCEEKKAEGGETVTR